MPITDKDAGLINSGAQLLGQGINAFAQGNMNKKTRKWNEKMYAQQRADSLADWNMQNEYNSPAAQMQRLKMAGLNPALVYKNGATSDAGPIRSSQVEGWNPRAPQFDLGAAAQGGLFTYLELQRKQAEVDNLKTMNTVATQDALLKLAQTLSTITGTEKTKVDTEQGRFNLNLAQQLMPVTMETASANLNKILADTQVSLSAEERQKALTASSLKEAAERILTSRLNRAKTKYEIQHIQQTIDNLQKDETLKQMDIDLRKMGIQPNDNFFLRLLGRIINDSPAGESLKGIIDNNFDDGKGLHIYDENGKPLKKLGRQ